MASSPSLGPRSGRYNLPPLRAGASTAQASLARIIGVISTVSPHSLDPPPARGDERGTRLDLRLRLGLPTEIGGGGPAARGIAGEVTAAEESISAAESVVGEAPASKSSDGECDPSGSGGRSPPKEEALRGHGKEYSEITNVREGEEEEPKEISSEGGGGGGGGAGESRRVGKASNGYLDLLLEAVREVLGGFLDEEHEGAAGGAEEDGKNTEAAAEGMRRSRRSRRSRSRRRRRKGSNPPSTEAAAAAGGGGPKPRREASWEGEGPLDVYEETGPIVRSKRGRSQTLPSRYRDSVLEPWTTKPPIVSRHGRAGRH